MGCCTSKPIMEFQCYECRHKYHGYTKCNAIMYISRETKIRCNCESNYLKRSYIKYG